MDLTLLLSSNSEVDVGAHNEHEQQEIQSEFRSRETLFKRKGINFSTTTNEGRILRSSQETDRRKNSRSIQHWKSRKDQNFLDKDGNSDRHRVRGKFMEEDEKNKPVVKGKVENGQGCDKEDGSKAKAQLSRREKLMAFISQKRQIDEEKRKKAKPVFRAGTVHHPYSVFSSASNLQNQSRMSMSSSNLSLMTQSSHRRQAAGFSRSSSLTNIKISSKIGKASLNKIIEDEDVPKQPKISEEPKKGNSFAPSDHKFDMKLDTIALKKVEAINPEVVKETFLESLSQTAVDMPKSNATLAAEGQELDKDKVQDAVEIESSHEDVKEFRDLLSKETTRINNLCQMWEDKIQTIPDDPDSELVKGELRSVVGQGRLVIKERFHQFSGLVDNCEFNRGEKKTTHEDLRGFWEMIFIQVEDVDRKFSNLSKVESNGWKEVLTVDHWKTLRSKIVSKSVSSVSDVTTVKPKKASSGLKALIAARRKAAKSVSEPPSTADEDSSKGDTTTLSPSSNNEAKKDGHQTQDEKTFDGGFFTVESPILERKSPRSSKSSSNKLRQAALSNNNKSVNSFLLSPFISAMSKISLAQGQSSGSPMSSEKLQSPLSPSRAPKPLILFKGDEEDEELKSEDLGGKFGIQESSSPKLDECYFRPTLTPASCVDLISLESPYEIEQ